MNGVSNAISYTFAALAGLFLLSGIAVLTGGKEK